MQWKRNNSRDVSEAVVGGFHIQVTAVAPQFCGDKPVYEKFRFVLWHADYLGNGVSRDKDFEPSTNMGYAEEWAELWMRVVLSEREIELAKQISPLMEEQLCVAKAYHGLLEWGKAAVH